MNDCFATHDILSVTLPTVYGEALSYYEELNKLICKHNALVKEVQNIQSQKLGTTLYIDVTNPGAGYTALVGDGNTDNTEAFQALANLDKVTLFFPAGIYATKPVISKADIVGAATNSAQILCLNDDTVQAGITLENNATIHNIKINGNKGGQSAVKPCLQLNAETEAIGIKCYNAYKGVVVNANNCCVISDCSDCNTGLYINSGFSGNFCIILADDDSVIDEGEKNTTFTNNSIHQHTDYWRVIADVVNTNASVDAKVTAPTINLISSTGTTIRGQDVNIFGTSTINEKSDLINIYNDAITAEKNEVSPTQMSFVTGLNRIEYGNPKTPIIGHNPAMYVDAYHTPKDDNIYSHNAYGAYFKAKNLGSGTSAPNVGTGIGVLGNMLLDCNNVGTESSPAYDYDGGVIGIAGFASANKLHGGTVCTALWGYAESPSMSATEFNAISDGKFSVIGLEVNLEIRHPDIGYSEYMIGGATAGVWCNNYREPGKPRQIMTFGAVFDGSPVDGDYSSLDINNWHSYHTAILLNKIQNVGLSFGAYMADGAIGIKLQDVWAYPSGGSHPNITALSMGDSKINMGNYMGADFKANDLWCNDGKLYFNSAGVTQNICLSGDQLNANAKPLILGNESTGSYPNNSIWTYNNVLYFKDNSGNTHTITMT